MAGGDPGRVRVITTAEQAGHRNIAFQTALQHQAITRARFVAGDKRMAARFEAAAL